MARSATVFTCSDCGHRSARWHGQCPGCGAWNTLVEEARAAPSGRRGGASGARPARPVRLADVRAAEVPRLRTGIGELDRVLGGGLVPGSIVLLGGSPGIGKSTLTNMALGNLEGAGHKTLYISGEESAAQIRLRAERLPGAAMQVPVLAETDLDTVLATMEAEAPAAAPSTSPGRSRRRRSACAPSACPARRSTCRPSRRPISRPCSPRSTPSGPRSA